MRNTEQQSDHICYTLLCTGTALLLLYSDTGNCAEPKQFSRAKPAYLDFSSFKFTVLNVKQKSNQKTIPAETKGEGQRKAKRRTAPRAQKEGES
jgi:hypothetical protein